MSPVLIEPSAEIQAIPESRRKRRLARDRPGWLPVHIPELDGLRGLAVIGVFCYHSHPRLVGTWFYRPSLWGWSGVSLFFVLSGFLITSILLKAKEEPRHYFRNFYARRALRIWPVYFVLVALCYFGPWWLVPETLLGVSRWKALPALIFFVQNLFPAKLLGALEPTWSLAIEEQYYFVWAPIVRFLRRPSHLAAVLAAVIVASPFLRMRYALSLNPNHTLFHLDCIAWGSLLGVGIMRVDWSRRRWLWVGIVSAVSGFTGAATVAGATSFLDSALGLGFAGIVLLAIAGTGARNPVAELLRRGPVAFYGKISYGLYLTHMAVFMSLGVVYRRLDGSSVGGTWLGNLAVVAIQFTLCTIVALLFWHGLEKRILRLKERFSTG